MTGTFFLQYENDCTTSLLKFPELALPRPEFSPALYKSSKRLQGMELFEEFKQLNVGRARNSHDPPGDKYASTT